MSARVAALVCVPWVVACGSPSEAGGCGATGGLVATTTDYTVGVLATVAPDGAVSDKIATVSGDPVIRWSGDALWQLNRQAGDTLRRYAPGSLCRPEWEVALPRGSNAHEVARVGDELWVTRYDQPSLLILDPDDGASLGEVDLSELDPDGLPDVHDVLWLGDRVYVGAQRFDRSVVPWASVEGRIAAIDPDTRSVVDAWPVGPSPRLSVDPARPDQLLVVTGTYGVADGGVSRFDPASGALVALLDEAEVGRDVERVVGVGDAGVVVLSDFHLQEDGASGARCVDLADWSTLGEREQPGAWVADAVAADDGVVWLAVRRAWGGDAAATGLVPVDSATCDDAGDPAATAFEPYSLTWARPGGG